MSVNETARTTVLVNNEEAKLALEELQAELKKIKQLRKEAFEKGDTSAFEMYDKQFKKIGTEAARMKKEIQSVESVLRNLNGASPNELTAAFRNLQKQMNNTSRTDPRFKELKAQAKLLKNEINSLNNEYKEQQSLMSKMSDGFNKYFGIITAGAASFAGLILAAKQAVQEFNDFQAKVSELSALTGLMGDDLNWLSDQAKELSTSTLDGGIKITKSASDILEAYKLMGSAKPELLGDKEALNEVTKQALILAEAAKMDTGPAVSSLANIMNQFSAPASDAAKYVNILAAGSQAGAAEVDDLAESIIKSGSAASQAKVSIEQEVALIETLGEKGVKAEVAGTGLKSFLLKLQSGAKDTNPAIVGMNTALENLAKKNMSAAEMTDKFGLETYTVASLLINNRQRYEELTTAVTGTTTAYQQAAINTDNNAAKLAQAKNKAQLYRIELGEKLAPAMTMFTSSGAMAMKTLTALVDLFQKHGTEILLVAGAIAAYNIALKINTAETKINTVWTKIASSTQAAWSTLVGVLTGKIKLASVAQLFWNSVVAANPIGALILGVALLAAGIIFLVKQMNAQTVAQKAIKDVTEQAKRDIIEQKNKTEDLLAVAKDEKKSLEERKAALSELNKISPEYFGKLSIEKSTTEELTKAGEAYIANLERQALVKAAQGKIDELRTENANKEIDIETKKTKWWETEAGAAKRRTKAINENKEAITELQKIVDKNKDKTVTTTLNTTTTTTDTTTPPADDEKEKKAKEKAAKLAQDLAEAKANAAIAASEREYERKRMLIEENIFDETEKNKALEALEIAKSADTVALLKKRLETEKLTAVERVKLQEEIDKEQFDLEKKLSKQRIEFKKENYKKELDELDAKFSLEKSKIEKEAAEENLSEDEKKAKLLIAEGLYYQEKLSIQKKYGADTTDVTSAIAANINEQAENAAKSDEDRLKKLADLKEKYLSKEVTAKEQLNLDLAKLDKLHQDGSIASYEEYQRLKTAINKKAEKERFNQVLEYGQSVQAIMNGVSDFFGAMKDKELAKAGDDEKKKEAIEAKYAKKQQNIAAFQAGINGAVAIMQLWASPSVLPEPAGSIYKGVMSAIIAGTTIAQVAAIKSKKFKSGSFTPSSPSDDTPVGIVHANEWVASAPLLRNPETRRHIDYLEAVQRNLSPRFNTAAISTASIGFKTGGFSSENGNYQSVTVIQQSDPELKALIAQNASLMQQNTELLQHLKDNGVKSNINAHEVFKAESDFQSAIRASEY